MAAVLKAIAFAVGCAVVYGANPWLKKAADIHWTHKEIPLPSYTVTINHPMIIYFLLWVLSVSALLAYICVVCFEMPLAHMEKMLFGNLPTVKRMHALKPEKIVS